MAKTHCPAGHPYEGDNLYVNPKGKRLCRACTNTAGRQYRARLKASGVGTPSRPAPKKKPVVVRTLEPPKQKKPVPRYGEEFTAFIPPAKTFEQYIRDAENATNPAFLSWLERQRRKL